MGLAAVRSAPTSFLQTGGVQKVILYCPDEVEELKPKRCAYLNNTKYGHLMNRSLCIEEI